MNRPSGDAAKLIAVAMIAALAIVPLLPTVSQGQQPVGTNVLIPGSIDVSTLEWWRGEVSQSILSDANWVAFDLATVLMDTLEHSPLIQSVSAQTSIALERTVQQDAAFDPSLLFITGAGRTNDPVGNTLTTGGPPRLNDVTFTGNAGLQQSGRTGRVLGLTQDLGLKNSNSQFFLPSDQANSRLSLSLTQPLYAGRGQLYNERLLTQARIDGAISWQEMRLSVEDRIATVMTSYWRLYEVRCHLAQQRGLLERGRSLERIIVGRQGYDAGPIELAKVRGRVAKRVDREIELQAEVLLQQSRLSALTGSEALQSSTEGDNVMRLELIPIYIAHPPDISIALRDAVLRGIENRPEIKAAVSELEAAALGISVTRNQLLPQIDAVVEAYLAGLRGNNGLGRSYIGQFADSGPGFVAGLQYELPAGRRYVKSKHREAQFRYRQKSEELHETMLQTRQAIESALIQVDRTSAQRKSKQQLLETALAEERILTRRWELMAADSSGAGLVLETLLDAQQRRVDAEREWVTMHTEYRISLVQLERAMGTLLIQEGIQPERTECGTDINFIDVTPHQDWTLSESSPPVTATESLPPAEIEAAPIEFEIIDSGLSERDSNFSEPILSGGGLSEANVMDVEPDMTQSPAIPKDLSAEQGND